jgi:plastocyanin
MRKTLPAVAAAAAVLAGCGSAQDDPNLIAGKQAFVERCGACHVLGRAGTKGVQGPNLDEAFHQALSEGMGRDGVAGVVEGWIDEPARFKDDKRYDGSAAMPADLVEGDAVVDVAAYVASVVAKPGEDEGLLASAVKQAGGGEPIAAEGGKLTIPADPGGQLLYTSDKATAPAGAIQVDSPNESGVPHNIVIDELGKGEVVQDGGVSTIRGELDAGTYRFYCSVPGHAEAGMEGELAVK